MLPTESVALINVERGRTTRTRPVAVAVVILAVIVVALALYQVFDSLTVHIPSLNSSDSIAVGLSRTGSFSDRLVATLPALGTTIVGTVALVGANRVGSFVSELSGSHESGGHPPEIPEVE
jgi:hypothetical protein